MPRLLRKVLGDPNERALKPLREIAERVEARQEELRGRSDEELAGATAALRARLAAGETVDDVLDEALAVAREAVARSTGERAYPVQIVGAAALHRGAIAEMKTGEGKTLVATLALYANALAGKGAHLVTVNDYLARRDAQWYGPALARLGLSVAVLQHDSAFLYVEEPASERAGWEHVTPITRREAYHADITYGTNNEFGFDYLRDNMATSRALQVQRGRHFAIVDEADSVLVDEARTPLIISGPAEEDVSIYQRFSRLVPQLAAETHFTVDARTRSVSLTEEGVELVERALGIDNLYALENFHLTRYMEAALRAEVIYQRDVDYVVKDGQVIIVDAFTGRLMEGRRWSDGLHQAVEAKESVPVQQESVTYATITLQNYFRMYETLSGMTGTAVTEAEEFSEIYKLEVLVIPTHRPLARQDQGDLVFRRETGKYQAVVEDIVEKHEAGRPVLVGTVAIESSELLSEMLRRRGIDHEVLNAKQHEREANIVERAGQAGVVTIATNMAGRGTDIKLGPGVREAGGLHVLGTERHESRRIDNQLRGRSGRQGDPGSSRFFVSFEDELMRRFAPDWLPGMMAKLGMDDDVPLESRMVSKAIESAQTRVETYNFEIRKNVVEYDDVMNTHRDVIYRERDKVLDEEGMRETVLDMVADEIDELGQSYLHATPPDRETFRRALDALVPLGEDLPPDVLAAADPTAIVEQAVEVGERRYEQLEATVGEETQRITERLVLLRTIDTLWVQHLTGMDEMRQGIGLRAYGQVDPKVAYKREAHEMWEQLLTTIRSTVARQALHARLTPAAVRPAPRVT
ncbi:MAG: preprotein translocase subunit SecA, partial [Chloroflexi bacterium]|nr:preprotein translocase subunit SecA [Chloroflexota bacterium]